MAVATTASAGTDPGATAVAVQRAIWSKHGRAACAGMTKASRLEVVITAAKHDERLGINTPASQLRPSRCAFVVSHFRPGRAGFWVLPDSPKHLRAVRVTRSRSSATVVLGGMQGLQRWTVRVVRTGPAWLVAGGGEIARQFR